jgi:hypothetical protein
MSLERRLKDQFEEEAARIEPPVAQNLMTIEHRAARRRDPISPLVLLLGALIIGILIVVRAVGPTPNPAPGFGVQPTVPGPSSGPSTYDAIAGWYSLTLDDSVPAVKNEGVGGQWRMELRPSGELAVSPPIGFRLGGAPPSGVAFSLSGDRFRTNLFFNETCGSIGVYSWELNGDTLTLTHLDDSCSVRATLLASRPWTRVP